MVDLLPYLVLALATVTEWRHAQRCRAVDRLAFEPGCRRRWIGAAPVVRVLCIVLVSWSLLELWRTRAGGGTRADDTPSLESSANRRLLILLDVSSSMYIADAGPSNDMTRTARGCEVLRTALPQLERGPTLTTILAFFADFRPVVVDAKDWRVVDNILDGLPLHSTFTPGESNLVTALRGAFDLAASWPRSSATLVVVTDGDTSEKVELPAAPPAIDDVNVVGVGSLDGRTIGASMSRQEPATLVSIAQRLHGVYQDCNARGMRLGDLQSDRRRESSDSMPMARRRRAVAAAVLGSIGLAVIPLMLALFGVSRTRETEIIR